MRLLIGLPLLALVISSPTHARSSTRLELDTPAKAIALGEPFTFKVILYNDSRDAIRVAPVFALATSHLAVHVSGDGPVSPSFVSGSFDDCSGPAATRSLTLGPSEFIGASFLVSASLPMSFNYLYGVDEGCYDVSATLRLGDRKHCGGRATDVELLSEVVTSAPKRICFTAPLTLSIERGLSQLDSGDFESVVEALMYFANVGDPRVGTRIRAMLGPPTGWLSRFSDPFHALVALRRQREAASAPYFREALGSRFSELATAALDEIPSGEGVPPP